MAHRVRFVRLLILLAVVTLSSLIASASAPSLTVNGTISGRVTSSVNGQPILNTVIQLYEESADDFVAFTTVDGSGNYSFNVPPGSYAVLTQNTQGFINEIYNNVQCSAVCDVNAITLLTVTTNTFSNIDFALDPGGRIAGHVQDSTTGLPIPNVTVNIVDSNETVAFTKGVTDINGNFLSEGGTVTGMVYALTSNVSGYQNEIFDNIKCYECDPVAVGATLIPVTNGITNGGVNFALDPGGRVSGTVRDGNGLPLANVHVFVHDANFTQAEAGLTDASGQYTSGGLPAGTYFAQTFNPYGYADQLYNGVPCPDFCNAPAAGTPITVTIGSNATNVDFTLVPGGKFSGSVTNAAGGAPVPLDSGTNGILVFNSSGVQILFWPTDGAGTYTTPALEPGTYYAQTFGAAGFGNQLYSGISCVNCNPLTGTPIVVTAGNTTPNINFALNATGTITGTVTNSAGGAPLAGVAVQFFTSTGTGAGSTVTNASGVYTMSGLATGSYYVRTNQGNVFINEIYNDIPCQQCNVTASGAPLVSVNAGATTSNIDFALTSGIRISGTITNANGGAALQGIGAQIFNSAGMNIGQFNTAANGFYITPGLPPGTYFVRTQNAQGFINKLYNNLSCAFASCSPTYGTPLTVAAVPVTQIDFSLSAGGRISGTVTSAGGFLLQNVTIQTYDSANRLMGTVNTDSFGNYTTQALPDGTYFLRTANNLGYLDERYDDTICNTSCSPLGGTPITITGGVNQTGKNFALAVGGFIAGVVREVGTSNPLQNIIVAVYSSNGQIVRTGVSQSSGAYVVTGLPAGTYYARTVNNLGYKDKIFNNLAFCQPSCLVTDGAPIVVTATDTTVDINFDLVAGTELIQNGSFNNGISSWQLFANLPNGTQDNNQLVWQVVNNSLQYYRLPTSASGVFLQNTGAAVAQGEGVLAQFDFANTSDVRKRISVLIHDGDFSDLSVCTFFAPPNSGARRYAMLTHSTKAWTNASISLYAATADSNGGAYQIDNVTMQTVSTPTERTDCVDPHRPGIITGPNGPELLTNRDFATGNTSGWSTFGSLSSQVAGGVFEFVRPSGVGPAGVILQSVGAGSSGQIYTARFDLGNSSNIRKRVTIILHDLDFSDLTACTFWLEPNTPLAQYAMQGYATQAWGNATVAIYAASVGLEQWTRLDNVSFTKTPGVIMPGTGCYEPASVPPAAGSESSTTSAMAMPSMELTTPASPPPATSAERAVETSSSGSDGVALTPIDLQQPGPAWLSVDSRSMSASSKARIEISLDGMTWRTLVVVPGSEDWLHLEVDLAPFAGRVVFVRLAFEDPAEESPGAWQIRFSADRN